MMRSTTRNSLLSLGSVLVLIFVWEGLSRLIGQEILLPSPGQTFLQLINILLSLSFWETIAATIGRGLLGFAISLFLGIVLGMLAGFSRPVFWLLQPWNTVLKTTPVMSVIILAIIWFQTDIVPVFVSLLMIFPIIYGNVVAGIRNVDPLLLEMARLYKVRNSRIIFELFLPSIRPYVLAGASTAMGLTWKVIIASEILSQPGFSIGSKLMIAKINLQTAQVFAWTVVAIVISFFFENLLQMIEKKFSKWGKAA